MEKHTIDRSPEEVEELVRYFEQYITENKQHLITEVLEQRTRHLTVVLENLYQPHNSSAVVRSCDIFGVQDLYIIENTNKFKVSKKAVSGSDKWVDIHRYRQYQNNTPVCFEDLKAKGYKIYGTSPHANGIELNEMPVDEQKVALIFGTEDTGLSNYALENADGFVRIPMYGFTESYNISVSVALCLYDLVHKMRDSSVNWKLSDIERNVLRLDWYKNMVRKADVMEKLYFESKRKP